jgi:hypothetical protein
MDLLKLVQNAVSPIISGIQGLFNPTPKPQPYQGPTGSTMQPPNMSSQYGPLYSSPTGQTFLSNYMEPTSTPQKKTTTTPGGGGAPTYTPPTPTTQPVNPAQKVMDTITSSYQKLIDNYALKGKEFDTKNPFVFDEVLASKRNEVATRLDPYYTQTLNDYVRGVEVKRSRSLEDEKTILADTNSDVANFTGKTKDVLEEALRTSAEGNADSGLFFSGLSLRKEGMMTNDANSSLKDYTTGAERTLRNAGTMRGRTLEDLTRESTMKTRDLNQEKYYNTESGALKETNLAQAKRDLERNQYIGAPFSTGSLSSLPASMANYL